MADVFHAGELAVQARAGVQQEANRLGKGIRSAIQPAMRAFLQTQRIVVVGSVDARGAVWASLLTGAPGFLHVENEQVLHIDATPTSHDPLNENLLANDAVGMLVIDLANRRRVRINGTAVFHPRGGLVVQTRQAYGNCPRYIQMRHEDESSSAIFSELSSQRVTFLSDAQQRWIAQADTFFVASFHPEGGVDASHRGGHPGFVHVLNENTLLWPDYNGNGMFQTLGNLTASPHAGLLFIDFERGHTLQLTGETRIIWDEHRTAEFIGAERLVEFSLAQGLETTGVLPLRWRFVEYSPHNPA